MFGELTIGLQGSPQQLENSTTKKENKVKSACKIKKLNIHALYLQET